MDVGLRRSILTLWCARLAVKQDQLYVVDLTASSTADSTPLIAYQNNKSKNQFWTATVGAIIPSTWL